MKDKEFEASHSALRGVVFETLSALERHVTVQFSSVRVEVEEMVKEDRKSK